MIVNIHPYDLAAAWSGADATWAMVAGRATRRDGPAAWRIAVLRVNRDAAVLLAGALLDAAIGAWRSAAAGGPGHAMFDAADEALALIRLVDAPARPGSAAGTGRAAFVAAARNMLCAPHDGAALVARLVRASPQAALVPQIMNWGMSGDDFAGAAASLMRQAHAAYGLRNGTAILALIDEALRAAASHSSRRPMLVRRRAGAQRAGARAAAMPAI